MLFTKFSVSKTQLAFIALCFAVLSGSAPAYARFSGVVSANSADANFLGEATSDYAGTAIASGDFNCDGKADVLVGAPYNDTTATSAGAAYIVYGPLTLTANVLSGANVTFTGEAASDYAGSTVANAGDVNGDNCDDILVGAPYNDYAASSAGAVYLIYGSSTLTDMSLDYADVFYSGIASGDYAGKSVAGAGDVNKDGYDDILIGAPGRDNIGSSDGAAYLIFGASTLTNMVVSGADVRFFAKASGDQAGFSVAGVGDVNGDLYDDFLIGAPYNDDHGSSAGAAYLIYGQSSAYPHVYYLSGATTFLGKAAGDYAGYSVANAGNVNGDGKSDFLIGAPYNDDAASSAGAAYLIKGRSSKFTGSSYLGGCATTFLGEAASDYAGWAVAGAGDINADGYDEILIGAKYNDDAASSAGAAYLVYGKSSTSYSVLPLGSADAEFTGLNSSDYAGSAISGAGDINADGYDDFLIASPNRNTSYTDAGVVDLFYGE